MTQILFQLVAEASAEVTKAQPDNADTGTEEKE